MTSTTPALRALRASISLAIGAAIALVFSSCSGIRTSDANEGLSFSHYDTPLYVQVTDRIKEKVSARLGEGKNPRDRFFIVPMAYQNRPNDPEYSHSFISVIRVFADGKQPQRTKELKVRTYKNREFEAFTISWLPRDFMENPHLHVFEGFGSRLIPQLNRVPLVEGKSFDLPDTITLARNDKLVVGMWGPYEISKGGFDLGVGRMRLLNEGKIKYRADDRLYREDLIALCCFHAMAGIYELYPKGGLFGTGFKIWGINGTRQVLREYTDKATTRGFLLEPVDLENDLYGWVYAPDRSERHMYDPFKTASAYRR